MEIRSASVVIAVAAQTFNGDHLKRRPAERRIPLIAADSRVLVCSPPTFSNSGKFFTMRAACSLAGDTRPERIEGGEEWIMAHVSVRRNRSRSTGRLFHPT